MVKHLLKSNGVVEKTTVHIKAAQIKKEIIRKINKKKNATSTSKVVHASIIQKSVVTSVGTTSKWSEVEEDDEEDKHIIDMTIRKTCLARKCYKILRKSKYIECILNFFWKKWIKNEISLSHCNYFSFEYAFHYWCQFQISLFLHCLCVYESLYVFMKVLK